MGLGRDLMQLYNDHIDGVCDQHRLRFGFKDADGTWYECICSETKMDRSTFNDHMRDVFKIVVLEPIDKRPAARKPRGRRSA